MKVPKRNIYQRIKYKKSLEKSTSNTSTNPSTESSRKPKVKKFKRVDPLAKAHLESLETKRIQQEKIMEIQKEKELKKSQLLKASKQRALKSSVLNSRNSKGQPKLGKSIEFLLQKIKD